MVWTILYLLMGYASYRVLESGAEPMQIRRAWIFYGLQLAANFLWPLLFFGGQMYLAALILLTLLWVLILWMIFAFRQPDRWAARLQIPYLLWVSFAGYLNWGVWVLN